MRSAGSSDYSLAYVGEDGADRKRLRMSVLDGVYGTVRSADEIATAESASLSESPALQVTAPIPL